MPGCAEPGQRDASATSCTAGHDELAAQDAAAQLTLGRQLQGWQPPGSYGLYQVSVGDFAGNRQTLTSQVFGGTTDFSPFIPSTTITLTP